MLERAKKDDRVAIYSGRLITKEEADRSTSKYIVQIGKYFLDGENTEHANGRYANYAPSKDTNARVRAGTKPQWDPIKKRWWVSIRATKTIGPNREVKIPYGRAYKGLPKKPKPMMRQVAATPANANMQTSNKGWRRACGRAMNQITRIAQRWTKAMTDMRWAMESTA